LVDDPTVSSPKDLESQLVRFGPKGTGVQLVEIKEEVVQGDAQGRFASETSDGEPDALALRAGKAHILHGPLELPPHNERVVVVTDLDKNEFAFVEAKGYARCIVAGARDVDWAYREEFARSKRTKKEIDAEEAAAAQSGS